MLDELCGVEAGTGAGDARDARADADDRSVLEVDHEARDGSLNAMGDFARLLGVRAVEDDGEFVSTHSCRHAVCGARVESGDGVVRTDGVFEHLSDSAENLVAGGVAVGVVDRLEPVEARGWRVR